MNMHVKLLETFKLYFEIKRSKTAEQFEANNKDMSFDFMQGVCSGLVAYWLYSKRLNKNLVFANAYVHEFEHVLNWEPDKFAASQELTDPDMEQFINAIMFLQYDVGLRTGVKQNDMHKSFALLSPDIELDEPELSTTFVFDHATLVKVLIMIVFPNKMIRITNGFHVIGLFKQDEIYNFYDPTNAPLKLDNPRDVATAIFNSFSGTVPDEYIALNFINFDLKSAPKAVYPDLNEYYMEKLRSVMYKNSALSHPNFFHLAARWSDFKIMDLIFKVGYKYVYYLDSNTEIDEAILFGDPKLLGYLLKKNFLPNHYDDEAATPIVYAIRKNSLQMVCMLLAVGADPNAMVRHEFSTLYYAIGILHQENIDQTTKANIVAVIIGSGAKVTQEDEDSMAEFFTKSEVKRIKVNAKKIKELLQQRDMHIKDLDAVVNYVINKPLVEHSVSDMHELLKILISLNIICAKQLSPFHPMHSYITLHARSTKAKLMKYLKQNDIKDLGIYLKERTPQLIVRGADLHIHDFVEDISPEDFYLKVKQITSPKPI